MTPISKALFFWWKTIDKYTLFAAVGLFTIGLMLAMTASPAIANKMGLKPSYFIVRHLAYTIFGFTIMIFTSTLSEKSLKKLAVVGFFFFAILTCLVPILGYEIKGAKRWIKAFGFCLQPSEMLKPCFVLLIAILLDRTHQLQKWGYRMLACLVTIGVIATLLMQPDIGTTILFLTTFCLQLFISGMPTALVCGALGMIFSVSFGCYMYFPHISARINRFFGSDLSYQTAKSLDAFKRSGLLGRGLGEGRIKEILPDAHTDFIFAVAAEEFGIITCIAIMTCFILIGMVNLYKATLNQNRFRVLSLSGLSLILCLQASINIAVSVNLIPTKGMTLPLLSYGGSSVISTSICIGMLLAITKKVNTNSRYQLTHFIC